MRVLLDTNILLRIEEPEHEHHPVAAEAVAVLLGRGHHIVLVPQVLYEFWVVATRPTNVNGLGLTPEETIAAVERFSDLYTLLRDERAIFDHWLELVVAHSVRGLNTHDTRLAAAMQRHRIDAIPTFNGRHFRG